MENMHMKIIAKINNIIKGTYFNIFNKHKDIYVTAQPEDIIREITG